jgi:dUTP pyrophosphatase
MKITKIRNVKTPARGTGKSAGIDFFIPEDFKYTILSPGEDVLIPSGIKANVPAGYMLMAGNKSGVATKNKLIKGAEIVDEDYTGEIHIHVINVGKINTILEPGKKLIQFILVPVSYEDVEVVDQLDEKETERGAGGFGSTGTH